MPISVVVSLSCFALEDSVIVVVASAELVAQVPIFATVVADFKVLRLVEWLLMRLGLSLELAFLLAPVDVTTLVDLAFEVLVVETVPVLSASPVSEVSYSR